MENQKEEESASTQLNQRLRLSSHELQPTFTRQEIQKRNRLESPPREIHAPPQCSKRWKNVKSSQPILPQDSILEIFSYFPVRSLLRLRCLSKSWKSLITQPFFATRQVENFKKGHRVTKFDIGIFFNIGSGEYQTSIIRSCSLSAIYEDPIINTVEVVDPLKTAEAYRIDWFMGSCNGLICIDGGRGTLYLLNPTLRACKRLPDLVSEEMNVFRTVCGFGFDASANDYKVVRVINGDDSIVRVYSLRTDSWKRIQNFPSGALCDGAGKYVDGSLNWSLSRGEEWIIVSLDLAQETYKEVPQPRYRPRAIEKTLGVLNGCLCVLCEYLKLNVDIWVMREYGKRESWIKLFSVLNLPDPLDGGIFSGTRKTLLYASEDEILLLYGAKVFLYNQKEKTMKIPVIHKDPGSYICQAESCVQSLVLPTLVNQQ